MKRKVALCCALVLGLTGSAITASGAGAAPPQRVLAPMASTALPERPSEAAALQMEQASLDMMAHPQESAGSWYDAGKKQVVLAVKGTTSASFKADLSGYTGRGARVQQAERSFADLQRLMDTAMALRQVGGATVNRASIDWRTNRVKVGIQPVTDAAREKLASLFGDAVSVQEAAPAQREDGPDRWRDRYPYWGGSAWSVLNGTSNFCSTAFPMKRPDNSKKFMVTAGHCNDPAHEAYTANTAGTVFNNYIGTAVGYANSLCLSTGSSCDIGSTKYGDISVLRVSGNAPYLYTGGARGNGSVEIESTQTGHPAVGDAMCVSASTTGTTCGYVVTENFTSVRYTNGAVMSPVVATHNTTGACTRGGDSGGAVYRPSSGAARASGIHSGGNSDPGDCDTYYTSIYYAQQLFDAVTVTTSNW